MEKLIAFFNSDQAELARQLNVSDSMISMCKKGKRKLSLDNAIKAEEITNGAVTVTDFYPRVQGLK